MYGDLVMQVDDILKQIRTTLKHNGLTNNTLLVFTSDNGCSPRADYKELAQVKHNPSYIYRGAKADIFEGGHRVPSIIKWPAQIPAGVVCEEVVSTMDLLPTFVEITGAQVPENHPFDGKSILNILKQEAGATSPHKYFFYGIESLY